MIGIKVNQPYSKNCTKVHFLLEYFYENSSSNINHLNSLNNNETIYL